MTRLKMIKKLKAILNNTNGESLAEALCSIFIFLLSLLTISIIINAAMTMNSTSVQQSTGFQKNSNNGIVGADTNPGEITFDFTDSSLDTSVKVEVYSRDGTVAFSPEVTGP